MLMSDSRVNQSRKAARAAKLAARLIALTAARS